MLVIIGSIVVFISTILGFLMAGGDLMLLMHVSEFVIIGGIALGVFIIASPASVIGTLVGDLKGNLAGKPTSKNDYLDLLKLLYEVFNLARKNGLIAVDEHISDPKSSSIFSKYDSFLSDNDRVEFLTNALRPIIDGKIKPEQLEGILRTEMKAKLQEARASIDMMILVADSLPGIGIVAAVLGIINTMSAIADGPEAVGAKVSAALTGTFLGIFIAYGFIGPFAKRVDYTNQARFLYFELMITSVAGFAKGLAPMMSIEVARRALESSVRPGADDLENMLKSLNK